MASSANPEGRKSKKSQRITKGRPVLEADEVTEPPSAHRPSRRGDLILAAVRVFARKGFIDATIQDIAEEAGVLATAVYYHFEGKEDLFDACIERVWQSLDKATAQARPTAGAVGPDTYARVIDAAWEWMDRYPDAAALLYLHLPGATPRSRQLDEMQIQRHTRRAFDYFDAPPIPKSRRRASVLQAQQSMTARTLMALVIGIHPMRLHDGPVSDLPRDDIKSALQGIAGRLLEPA